MIWWRLRNKVREVFWLPPLAPRGGESVPPHPRLELVLGRAVPGALVRLFPAVAMVVVGALIGPIGPWGWALLIVLATAVTWRPRRPIAPGFVLLVGLWVFIADDLLTVSPTGAVEGVWRVSVLVFAVHALLVASTFVTHVAWRGLVDGAVLWRVIRSLLGVQAFAQTLLLLSAWLRAGFGGQVSNDWLRLVGVGAVVGVVLLAVPRQWLVRRTGP